jgi:hypothetical protein
MVWLMRFKKRFYKAVTKTKGPDNAIGGLLFCFEFGYIFISLLEFENAGLVV